MNRIYVIFFTLYLVGKHKILIINNKDIQLALHISVHNYNVYKSKSLLYFLAYGKHKKWIEIFAYIQ